MEQVIGFFESLPFWGKIVVGFVGYEVVVAGILMLASIPGWYLAGTYTGWKGRVVGILLSSVYPCVWALNGYDWVVEQGRRIRFRVIFGFWPHDDQQLIHLQQEWVHEKMSNLADSRAVAEEHETAVLRSQSIYVHETAPLRSKSIYVSPQEARRELGNARKGVKRAKRAYFRAANLARHLGFFVAEYKKGSAA